MESKLKVLNSLGAIGVYIRQFSKTNVGIVETYFRIGRSHGYLTFSDRQPRQPPILTARIDRVLAVMDQKDRPVAQKMRTGLFYLEIAVLGKNRLKFFVLIYSA